MNQIFSNQFFTLMDLGSLEPKHAAEIWEAVSRVGLREKISSLLDVLHYRRLLNIQRLLWRRQLLCSVSRIQEGVVRDRNV
jgi:hypothetical protein